MNTVKIKRFLADLSTLNDKEIIMSNDLAIISQEEIDALAKRAGTVQTVGDYIPQLKVNYDDEDEDGNELRKGEFFVTGQDKVAYAKSVVFRPLTHHFQWTKYDKVSEKVTNRTRLIPNFREEPRDETGTVRCGKPPSKDLKANPALAAKYDDITCYRQVQGLVSYKGKTATGEEVEVKDLEVSLRLKGANFSPFEEDYFSKLGNNKLWDFEIPLYTDKAKNGASTYFVIRFDKADFGKRLQMSAPVFKTALALQDRVDVINKEVDTKYYDAVHSRTRDDDAISQLKTVGGKSLNDDFDDDIPF
jgi:hypothetical protein